MKKEINPTVDLVLTIFLGWLGAHHFYRGKNGIGVLYLLTVGLFGIGWIVDIVSGVIKTISKDVSRSPFENNHSEHVQVPPPDATDQAKATYQIIKETSSTGKESIKERTAIMRERSDRLYEERQRCVASFDPMSVQSVYDQPISLTSVELSFLQYMNGVAICSPYIPAYWVYEYNIDFPDIMKKLMQHGYLKISTPRESVPFLKVPELKELLKNKKLKLSGKKAELIDRVLTSFSDDELSDAIPIGVKKYVLTEKGKTAVRNQAPSATKDIDFEDRCIEAIINGDVDGAYKMVCQRETARILPRGIGIDWQAESENGLSDFLVKCYTDFLARDISKEIPEECLNHEMFYKASVILCIMLGKPAGDAVKVFLRISAISPQNKSFLTECMQNHQFVLMEERQHNSFAKLGVEKYEVLGTFDVDMCDFCGEMDGKVFLEKDRKIGENAPPFHPGCRCTTVPYYDDMVGIGERWMRDPETGKGGYVPSDMTFKEWKEIYVDKTSTMEKWKAKHADKIKEMI